MITNKLYIQNIDDLTTKDQLEHLFSIYGCVDKIILKKNNGTGFIKMTSPLEARRAKDNLNGEILWGRKLKINSLDNSFKNKLFYVVRRYI